MAGLLDDLHAPRCDGTEYSAVRPKLIPDIDREGGVRLGAIFMAWCGECGAADWEVVE